MTIRERILLESKAWSMEKMALDKGYFQRLSSMHVPHILWIGSSDSLVPVREVTNTEPGEILVYRNMGNLIKESDLSLMALLQDAVEVSKVKIIILCGYSHCSSLREVIKGTDKPLINEWLQDLRDIYERNREELEKLPYENQEKRLAELNIEQQVKNLSNLEIMQRAWRLSSYPKLYGWYFDLNTGSFTEVINVDKGVPLDTQRLN
ncbi:MAG: carbonic anhydrase [Cyclobacteriaceae bacterium]|nr:carbonic anhydrase [Cyclobacteriaceae bacterium]